MRSLVAPLCLSVLAVPAVERTDQQLDLTGHWVVEASQISPNGPREPFCNQECSIEQDNKTLVVRHLRNQRADAVRYRLDGVPETRTVTSGRYRTEVTITARYKDGALMISTKAGSSPERSYLVSLEKGRMVVAGSRRGFGGSDAARSKVTYTRRPTGHPAQRH